MDRWRGKVAIVTGASAGIGAAIAEKLVEAGLLVVGFARRCKPIEDLAEKLQDRRGKLYAIKADITQEEDVLKVFKWTCDNLGSVHILVNNAGIIHQGNLTTGDTEKWRKIIDTNVIGLSIATREAIKIMKTNNIDGHIININSISGHYVPPVPGANLYPASKHTVTALTETLRQELNFFKLKIKITSISPGLVATEYAQTNDFKIDSEMAEFLKGVPILQSEDIADAVMYVLSTPPHVQVQELTIKPVGETF